MGLGAAFQIAYSQRVLGNDQDDRVSVNFFGDGTCNVGAFLVFFSRLGWEVGARNVGRLLGCRTCNVGAFVLKAGLGGGRKVWSVGRLLWRLWHLLQCWCVGWWTAAAA